MEIINQPLLIIFVNAEKKTEFHLYPTDEYGYEAYGLLICDAVRHVAAAFQVPESAVWEWVDKERAKPTTTISGETTGGPKGN